MYALGSSGLGDNVPEKSGETRLMLTEEQYFFIVTYYMNIQPNKHFLQITNHYYDTDELNLTKDQRMTLRVRIINDVKSELTLKIKGEDGDEEVTDGLSPKEQELLLEQNIFPYGQVRNRLMLLPKHVLH